MVVPSLTQKRDRNYSQKELMIVKYPHSHIKPVWSTLLYKRISISYTVRDL